MIIWKTLYILFGGNIYSPEYLWNKYPKEYLGAE